MTLPEYGESISRIDEEPWMARSAERIATTCPGLMDSPGLTTHCAILPAPGATTLTGFPALTRIPGASVLVGRLPVKPQTTKHATTSTTERRVSHSRALVIVTTWSSWSGDDMRARATCRNICSFIQSSYGRCFESSIMRAPNRGGYDI